MKRIIVVPTILAMNEAEFKRRWARITPASRRMQVDFMDGRFVPTKSVSLVNIPDVRGNKKEFEAHLMVKNPARWAPPLLAKGFKRLVVHIETISPKEFHNLATLAHASNAVLIAAINPTTKIKRLGPYLKSANGICVLGVRPGHNGAPYNRGTPDRIRTIRLLCALAGRRRIIQVDGGMTPQTIGAVVRSGATRINSGSYVGNAADPKRALLELERAASIAAHTTRKVSA